jgi:hypothetical protein
VISVAVRHGLMDVIDGSLESASPCPSESQLWLQGTLILAVSRDLVIPVCQIGRYGQGLPPVMLNFEYLKL